MRLLIVDDHDIVRKGIVATLGCDEALQDILEAATIDEAMEVMIENERDLILVDISLAGKNGLDLIEQAREENIKAKLVVFTSSSRKGDFDRAKELDVDGYILKDSNIEDIIYAIKLIGRGCKFYDPLLTQEGNQEGEQILALLTQREQDVFREIGRGLKNMQIADKFYISENTVKKHTSSLLAKLGVKNRTEIAIYATKIWGH